MAVHFGNFTLDESQRQLSRSGERIRLSPKAYEFLSILIQERPQAVSKSVLLKRLWPDTFVTEGNLATIVAELRSALGDDAREPRFIRTLHGFGYSFAASVDGDRQSHTRFARQWKTLTIAGLLVAAAMVLILSLRSSTEPRVVTNAPIRSIAVLPFDTSGSDRADEHLGLGLPDLIITRLTNVHHLVVRPTSAIRDFAGHRADAQEIGRKLQVDAVLEGTIRTSPDRIRVTIQLLNVRDQKPIWAEPFDAKRSDMFSIEDSISARVAEALTTRLTPNERTLLSKHYTANPQAYDLYIQGRYQLERAREGAAGSRKEAAELFQKAVEKDPSYALAWAGFAQANAGMGVRRQAPLQVAFPTAETAAAKALQLDQDLSEAHCAAGAVRMHWHLDFEGAEKEFRRALELNPRNTIALDHYGFLLMCLQRFDEAIAVRERHVEVDPLSVAAHWGLANTYLTSRQDAQGIQQTMLVLAMNPSYSDAYNALTRFYTMRGEYDRAIAYAQKNMQMNATARNLAFLGYALGRAGRKAEANKILEQLKRDKETLPFYVAFVRLGLGEREAVFPLLEKGLNDRSYVLRLKTEPILDPIRSDPRFVALLQRAGFKG
ncbi:MAG TPA: winged helix-turn-helix domain-containing protein [Thermoanaerobaculia bacterium]|nr:winged helix-turn-helix domain-containing protein [Thermoanaerobaculia bacterium]